MMRREERKKPAAAVVNERNKLLKRIEQVLEGPLIVLGFVWLVLLIVELIHGSKPMAEKLSIIIWIIFIVDFILKFILAPFKIAFLKKNILTIISLIVPAFRVLRALRFIRWLRFSRSLRLVKVLGSINRGMRALAATMSKRAFGFIVVLTMLVILSGAAGMYAFEKDVEGGLPDYSTALWWTTMIMTTLGSEYWPQTTEGRILCVVLSLYAFAVFGYITATIATFFIDKDAESNSHDMGLARQLHELREEIAALRKSLNDDRNKDV